MPISALIDKQDNFEVIRDQIAAILVLEIASQMQLATDAGKDPADWNLKVYSERSNPWEQFLNDRDNPTPIVNLWYDNSSFISGNIVERQASQAVFNIDCYGYGISGDDGNLGHVPGDREAALIVQRAVRLVRNILMAAEYTYLGLQGLVWKRWTRSITIFQPQMDGRQAQQIVGARIACEVTFNEFSPQIELNLLEYVSIDVIRAEDGEIVLEADYDYTV